jgi:phage-related protein
MKYLYAEPTNGQEALRASFLNLQNIFESVKSIGGLLMGSVKEPFSNFVDGAGSKVYGFTKSLSEGVANMLSFTRDEEKMASIQATLSGTFQSFFNMLSSVGGNVGEVFGSLKDAISSVTSGVDASTVLTKIGDALTWVFDTVRSGSSVITSVFTSISGPLVSTLANLGSKFLDLGSQVKGIITGLFSFTSVYTGL